MSWDKIDSAKEGGGIFIKMKDGDVIEGVFMGDPYVYYQIYQDKTEYSDYVPGSSMRFRINFVMKENGQYISKLFTQGVTVAKQIREYLQEYGPNSLFKIKRNGSGKDNTTYTLLYKGSLSKENMDKIRAVKLLPLTKKVKDDVPPPFIDDNRDEHGDEVIPSGPLDDDIPF